MNIKKIAAHYELMKLADTFQSIMKNALEGQVGADSLTIADQTDLNAFLMNLKKIVNKKIQDRYAIQYDSVGNASYQLKPEFQNEYKKPYPTHPNLDPNRLGLSIGYTGKADIVTQGGRVVESANFREERPDPNNPNKMVETYIPRETTIFINLKLDAKNTKLAKESIDVNGLKNMISSHLTNQLLQLGRLSQGNIVPPEMIDIKVNGELVG